MLLPSVVLLFYKNVIVSLSNTSTPWMSVQLSVDVATLFFNHWTAFYSGHSFRWFIIFTIKNKTSMI